MTRTATVHGAASEVESEDKATFHPSAVEQCIYEFRVPLYHSVMEMFTGAK